MQVSGTVTVVGDDVDTDVIFPARYLAVLDRHDQAKHLFEPLGPDVRQSIIDGGILVAGWNFGCGSSREHAVTSMIGAKVRLVIAKSFSRIFFRNAINIGLPVIAAPQVAEALGNGDSVAADLAKGDATISGKTISFAPLSPSLLHILTSGGLWAASKETPRG